ncbi:restriction endonuclease [Ethanoligenens harbinense]|uniref:Restriction endonuclease n=1 Tax=Ethanoligenens harbinense (strain DSM 18485 / JCM 12961 / CGMCC 1.5033 / YUAN-3) TaxID=663278 RepID=E6U3U8_ETHHY|nr:restriction endonuclease [Ethanoligenens harbinense]ADU26515.1 restriction endonuclease [Ethanoligenens harbinense YUAN-3]AVQ95639.1 restriction endonuclease [Ethanoligenens harbinense YUAN-3]AYF38303.1 restriction endonuclease [Ethanoligenens harbinense]AYF41049.1 restriction endonuclease [Ethanoligenens harbinense]QCN91880.1 restriction endonuclease [Ethanoligenens harbinense]
MAIPAYDDLYNPFLESIKDSQPHSMKEIKGYIIKSRKLSESDLEEMTPSGKVTLLANRVGWCCTYLKKAGLIASGKRGIYNITVSGLKALAEKPVQIDNEYLMQFESFQKFVHSNSNNKLESDIVPTAKLVPLPFSDTPQDAFERAYEQINNKLADDIMDEIMQQSSEFFEETVVQLLQSMGYGGSIDNSGMVVGKSGDEGIDGIVKEDKLGFNVIYIQAKRWNPDVIVGRPEVQKFVGALSGQGASKGLFITTARFSKDAKDYVSKQHTAKVILVDGEMLTKLMIDYNLGVSPIETYQLKRVDTDFFSNEDNA